MVDSNANLVTISEPSRAAVGGRACPWCRRAVDVSEAAFFSTLVHPACAPKIRARETPLELLERFAGLAIGSYAAVLVGGMLAFVTVRAIVGD